MNIDKNFNNVDQQLKKNLFPKKEGINQQRQVLLDAKWSDITRKHGKSREEKERSVRRNDR